MGCILHKHLQKKLHLTQTFFTQTKAISLGVALIIKGGFMAKQLNKVRVVLSHRYGKCITVANAVRDRVYIKCSCGAFTIIELDDGKKNTTQDS